MSKAAKQLVRKQVRERVSRLSVEDQARESRWVQEKVIESELFQRAKSVSLYLSTSNELDTSLLLEASLSANKKVYVPWVSPSSASVEGRRWMLMTPLKSKDELSDQKLFSSESAPLISQTIAPDPMPQTTEDLKKYISENPIDLLIIPGLAFHPASRTRLGKGGGFYDHFLGLSRSLFSPPPSVVGVCFSAQITDEELPCNEFDQLVDSVVFPQP